MSEPEVRPMTVGELKALLAPLADDEPIFVDGYEGGYSKPKLAQRSLATLDAWVRSSGYCGAWSDARTYAGEEGVPAWVLHRGGEDSFDE